MILNKINKEIRTQNCYSFDIVVGKPNSKASGCGFDSHPYSMYGYNKGTAEFSVW